MEQNNYNSFLNYLTNKSSLLTGINQCGLFNNKSDNYTVSINNIIDFPNKQLDNSVLREIEINVNQLSKINKNFDIDKINGLSNISNSGNLEFNYNEVSVIN